MPVGNHCSRSDTFPGWNNDMNDNCLVGLLFPGPLDIVGDVHGEIEPLRSLLGHLGYAESGVHPGNRRLVFLGDLTDRGPDSPGVVDLVARYVERGHAQCVLGNHELNILLERCKEGNAWFFGKTELMDDSGVIIPQRLATDPIKERLRAFFGTLPLALEREDLRIVHACWCPSMIAIARQSADAICLYQESRDTIESDLTRSGLVDRTEIAMSRQNKNPVKVLTSGREVPSPKPFKAGGKLQSLARYPWWNDYAENVFCVFGHYEHFLASQRDVTDNLFGQAGPNVCLGNGCTLCIDYGVAKKWKERLDGGSQFTALGALRFPEKIVVFDDGRQLALA
jgi:hypothetical protein